MAIHTSILKSAASRRSFSVAKSMSEALSRGQQTAFLCHSHKDEVMAKGLQEFLKNQGWDVYIDWQDNEMPEKPDKQTARKIKSKIVESRWFLFLATANSRDSRWCPWEIGYADTVKGEDKIIIVPTEGNDGWNGNEYLNLYKRIDTASNKDIGRSGYAIFEAGSGRNGKWLDQVKPGAII